MLDQNRAMSRISSAPYASRNSRSRVTWKYCQTLYAMALPTWRWSEVLSGIQRPERGFRFWRRVTSSPLLPLCHGNIAPA